MEGMVTACFLHRCLGSITTSTTRITTATIVILATLAVVSLYCIDIMIILTVSITIAFPVMVTIITITIACFGARILRLTLCGWSRGGWEVRQHDEGTRVSCIPYNKPYPSP